MSLNQLELITLFESPKTCTYDKIIAMTSLKYILHHTYQQVILIAFYVHLAQKNSTSHNSWLNLFHEKLSSSPALIREGFEKQGENRYSCQKKVHFSNHENKWPRGAKILQRRKTCSSFLREYSTMARESVI